MRDLRKAPQGRYKLHEYGAALIRKYHHHEQRCITYVYGDTIKELIHEKFGDGIMSPIDFDLHVDKVPDPKGDRVCG